MNRLKLWLGLALLVTPAWAEAPQVAETDAGPAYVDSKGMTLYVHNDDFSCTGECLKRWPPALAKDGDVSPIFAIKMLGDSGRQWVLDGQPLYLWKLDLEPGQATGDGVGGVWHIARPAVEEPQ